jgi:hypothetical protein
MSEPPPPPADGRLAGLVKAVQGLTLTNVLVIALLAPIVLASYTVWKTLSDPELKLLDRLLSTYEEIQAQNVPCVLRHTQRRGGPEQWGISSGFAFMGGDRYLISVVLQRRPTDDEMVSYCETLKILSDQLSLGKTSENLLP